MRGGQRLLFSSDKGDEDNDDEDNDDYTDDDEPNGEAVDNKLDGVKVKDFDMEFLRDLVERGELDLQPFYQRGYKWSQKQASLWIESILRGYPSVPEIILLMVEGKDGEQKYVVFDGQQRLTSSIKFLKNQPGDMWGGKSKVHEFRLEKLPLLKQFEGMRYQDLPKEKQNLIKHFGVRCAIIPVSWKLRDCIDFFRRIQAGGTKMTAQELRRAISQGPFTDLLDKLSRETVVQQALNGLKPFSPGSDETQELLLRYFQYQLFGGRFGKPTIGENGFETMKHFNREMKSWSGEDVSKLGHLKEPLLKSLHLIIHVFGPHEAFRLPKSLMKKGNVVDDEGPVKLWVNQTKLKAPLWDCIVSTFAKDELIENEKGILENAESIRSSLIHLMQTDPLFTDKLRSSDISKRVRVFEHKVLSIVDSSGKCTVKRNVTHQQRRDLIKAARQRSDHCNICGQPLSPFDEHLHIDHIRPISKAGSNDSNNLQVVHKICNLRKSNKV